MSGPIRIPDGVAGPLVRTSIGRAMRTGLAGVWVRGALPGHGAVVASCHRSWWDGYVLGGLAGAAGTTSATMMTSHQLAAFPFLRLAGAVPPTALRTLATRAATGHWAVLFPEGALRPVGAPLDSVHGGAAWVAGRAGVAVHPAAIRVAVRGGRAPEALVRFGAALTPQDAGGLLTEAMAGELEALEQDIAAADPEHDVPGYRALLRTPLARPTSPGAASRMLSWLTRT